MQYSTFQDKHTHTQKSNKMTLLNLGPFSRLAHRPNTHTHTYKLAAQMLWHTASGVVGAGWHSWTSTYPTEAENVNTHTHTHIPKPE